MGAGGGSREIGRGLGLNEAVCGGVLCREDACVPKRLPKIVLWTQVAGIALLAGCGGGQGSATGGGGGQPLAAPQMVFMYNATGGYAPPGQSSIPWELFVMNLDGTGRRQLTNDGKFKFLPHFSPDGSKIVYTKFAVGGYGASDAKMDIFVYDLASGKDTQLTFLGNATQGAWSPDGTRIVYNFYQNNGLTIMNADGSNAVPLGQPSGALDDMQWADPAWSSDDWILFVVAQTINSCYKVRVDKIRPDGSERTQVTDGGNDCTPAGYEQSGDADPGWSPDAKTIYSSRGFAARPANSMIGTERKLYSFSSDAWFVGKTETDLSLPSEPSCIEGVPKASPDGTRVLLFRLCFDVTPNTSGIYVTDTAGSYRTFITPGFGPDWNPAYKP